VRIISGVHKGRNVFPPKNLPVRPTTDFAKESLFNIINNNFDYEEISVLDLFSGTGAISYEFASRGARSVTSVDLNYKCYTFIKKTAEDLKLDTLHVIKSDAFQFIQRTTSKYDIVFADAPYELPELVKIPEAVLSKGIVKAGGWLIVEHSIKTSFKDHPLFDNERVYGNVHFSFFIQP
jgi:16S rRNA (guanine(966)-N(2))-methyltransferase RsmD